MYAVGKNVAQNDVGLIQDLALPAGIWTGRDAGADRRARARPVAALPARELDLDR
jgi:hypothetical protein